MHCQNMKIKWNNLPKKNQFKFKQRRDLNLKKCCRKKKLNTMKRR